MQSRRRHAYYALMAVCLFLIVLAWNVVRLWSVPAAVVMSLVAMVIPPIAAVVANRRGPDDAWWDDPAVSRRVPRPRQRPSGGAHREGDTRPH
ncbi:DUF3099 domain-containing protein [Streptacidiphilus sp. MAP5-3]|uniref:DUF3099 domain-containing protein n=1 Tax=unclassified Streptacidiphilus TaxID=2643834 RepID=UPI003519BAA8